MHVLLIHQAFAHPDEPGGTRHYELACHLVRAGHRVTIIAGGLNYLTGRSERASDPEEPGLRIVRIRSTGRLHRSYAERALSFFAFAAGALRASRRLDPVDLVWGTSPPLVQLLPAWLVSLAVRARFVFEERDLWPEFAIDMRVVRDGVLTRAALRFKRLMYRAATRIMVNSPGFVPTLLGYGVPCEKLEVIPNGVDVTQFDPAERGADLRAAWQADGRFVVVYAGAIGPANDLGIVLDAAEQLRGTPALFVLVGDGKARAELEAAATGRGLDNVRFFPAQPKRRMKSVLGASDACLASLRDIPLFTTTYPNKVFDYMAAGRPVLLAIDGVIREVVDQAQAGVFVPPGNGRALAAAVRSLMDDRPAAEAMGARGRRAVSERFDRRVHADRLERMFCELLEPASTTVAPKPEQPRRWAVR